MNARERMGQRISQLRIERGLTQTDLADRSGLGQGHIARIEQGKYGMTLDTLQAIAEALDMTVDIIDKRLAGLTRID